MKYNITFIDYKKKLIALMLTGVFCMQLFLPSAAFALTEGPGQPEMATFQQVGIDNLVNPFSGDFNYNIPLLNVPGPEGGYPINLIYDSNIGMEQEASWTGLGWNVNVGSVNRVKRGLPDDFNSAPVRKKNTRKTTLNVSVEFEPEKEVTSLPIDPCLGSSSPTFKVSYNNMAGLTLGGSYSPSFAEGAFGMDLNFASNEGLSFNPSINASILKGALAFQGGASINSLHGVTSTNFSMHGTITRKGNKGPYKGGAGFSSISYVPRIQYPTVTVNSALGFKYGSSILLYAEKPQLTGAVSRTSLLRKEHDMIAFGYLYSQNSSYHETSNDDEVSSNELMDFNMEHEGQLSRNSPFISNVIPTGDIYSVSAQGYSNVFSSFRNDHGFYHYNPVKSVNTGMNFTTDFGSGVAPSTSADVGARWGVSYSESYSGPIEDGIFEVGNDILFTKDNGLTQGAFFKSHANMNVKQDQNSYKDNNSPARLKIRQMPSAKVFDDLLEETDDNGEVSHTNFNDKSRETATSVLLKHTNQDLSSNELIKGISINDLSGNQLTSSDLSGFYDRTFTEDNCSNNGLSEGWNESNYNRDQIGAFETFNSNGTRYEYGIPVYNNYHKDVLFSTDAVNYDSSSESLAQLASRTINYLTVTGEKENSLDNKAGEDNFYSSDELPPYVYSHLLTAVYSPDYVDVGNDGPSEDDLGYYTKFSYTKAADNYAWRTPFAGANFMPNLMSNELDDKANYSYGTKEVYYLNKVETKTHFAEFIIEERADAKSANQEDQLTAQVGAASSYKLVQINLYSKNGSSTPEKIQTVNFNYDYSLCPGVLNFDSSIDSGTHQGVQTGKLTLLSLSTIYYDNEKGEESPYVFDYGQVGQSTNNPSYDQNKIDHWGNYKATDLDYQNYLGSVNFNPYTVQTDNSFSDSHRADQAGVWKVKRISLPSGGEIEVNYESDEYAYVQNKKAQQFYEIVGLNDGASLSLSQINSATNEVGDIKNSYKWIHVRLDNQFNGSDPVQNQIDAQNYLNYSLEGLEDIYFKVYMKLIDGFSESAREYVTGYANRDLTDSAVAYKEGAFWYGKFKVNMVNYLYDIHPFKMAGFNHMRYERPDLFTRSNDFEGSVENILMSIFDVLDDATALITGFVNAAEIRNYCDEAFLSSSSYPSMVRLNNGDGHKYGGGHRVKSITISDKWNDLVNWQNPLNEVDETTSSYTINYTYELSDQKSSGVATYEPRIGGEENALKSPYRYKAGIASFDEYMWAETPINDVLHPNAGIGYSRIVSKVTGNVESWSEDTFDRSALTENDIDRLKSPITVNEYFTAYDFPTISDHTGRREKRQIPSSIVIPCFGTFTFKNSITSQGYSIILNNMHGKMRSVSTYHSGADPSDPYAVPYSSVEHEYSLEGNNEISNEVVFYHPETGGTSGILGRSVEVATFMNENSVIGMSAEIIDADAQFIPTVVPSLSYQGNPYEERTKVVSTNKIVHLNGILKSVKTKKGDSYATAENIAFDKITGEPIIVKKTNNHDGSVYLSSIPAHWNYSDFDQTQDRLGYTNSLNSFALQDEGLVWDTQNFNGFTLKEGDKVLISDTDEAALKSKAYYVDGIDLVDKTISFKDYLGNGFDYSDPNNPFFDMNNGHSIGPEDKLSLENNQN